mmetsp:Transcript_5471/g.9304  ORF Transcript_5471/g.9304 Transcript_5471/m.9304 type:complete len:210 (+) Transcript_5471:659-1288(+)
MYAKRILAPFLSKTVYSRKFLLLLGFAHRLLASKDATQHQTHNETNRDQNEGSILPHLDNMLKVIRNHANMLVAVHHLSNLLHFFIHPRRGHRYSFALGLFVSAGGKGCQRINIPATRIAEHGALGKVKERGISSNLEATADGLLLCAVNLGQENSISRRFDFYLIGQFIPHRSELLAVSAPRSVELDEPLPRRLARRCLRLMLKGRVG